MKNDGTKSVYLDAVFDSDIAPKNMYDETNRFYNDYDDYDKNMESLISKISVFNL